MSRNRTLANLVSAFLFANLKHYPDSLFIIGHSSLLCSFSQSFQAGIVFLVLSTLVFHNHVNLYLLAQIWTAVLTRNFQFFPLLRISNSSFLSKTSIRISLSFLLFAGIKFSRPFPDWLVSPSQTIPG